MNLIYTQRIWTELSRHPVTLEQKAEGWCYDQLLGAGVFLQMAAKVGTPGPNAESRYRAALLALQSESAPQFKEFAWGLYLNSAIQRVVWGCERLLRFAANEDRETENNWSFPRVVREVRKRHEAALRRVVAQFPVTQQNSYEREDAKRRMNETPSKPLAEKFDVEEVGYTYEHASEKNILHILRGRVNRQKHWSVRTDSRPTYGQARCDVPWDRLDPVRQHYLVTWGLWLLIDLFWELEETGKF